MWASNLHLPLCLSRRGTRPEFVNSERGNIKAERERGREGEKEGGRGGNEQPPQNPTSIQPAASSLVK